MQGINASTRTHPCQQTEHSSEYAIATLDIIEQPPPRKVHNARRKAIYRPAWVPSRYVSYMQQQRPDPKWGNRKH